MSRRTHVLGLFSLATLLLPISVKAADPIVVVTTKAAEPLQNMNFTFYGTAQNNALAGTLNGTLDGTQPFDMYCVDNYDDVVVGNDPPSQYAVFTKPIATLAGTPTGSNGAGVGYLYQTYAGGVKTGIQGAGLQIAIWKVVYDNGGSLASGNFQVADGAAGSVQDLVFNQANTYLSTYTGTQTGNATWLQATTHPNHMNQDFVGPMFQRLSNGKLNPVPEPSSVAAIILGSLSVAGLAMRKRRASFK